MKSKASRDTHIPSCNLAPVVRFKNVRRRLVYSYDELEQIKRDIAHPVEAIVDQMKKLDCGAAMDI